jgi:hypothetical protein
LAKHARKEENRRGRQEKKDEGGCKKDGQINNEATEKEITKAPRT